MRLALVRRRCVRRQTTTSGEEEEEMDDERDGVPKPRERRERENAIVDEGTFPDATPAWTEKKTTTTRVREIFGGTQQTKRDAVKRRMTLARAMLQKADEETRSTCTFQPKAIAKRYLEEDSERRKARRERLLQSRLDIVRERSGEEGGEGNVREGGTFRPKF